jgi:dephospho-CoA kinase
LIDEKKNLPLIIIDAPLLFETSLDKLCDKTITIWTKDEIRIKRLMKAAKFSRAEIEKRDAAQMSIDEKMKRADFIIDNSGSRGDLLKQIEEFLRNK